MLHRVRVHADNIKQTWWLTNASLHIKMQMYCSNKSLMMQLVCWASDCSAPGRLVCRVIVSKCSVLRLSSIFLHWALKELFYKHGVSKHFSVLLIIFCFYFIAHGHIYIYMSYVLWTDVKCKYCIYCLPFTETENKTIYELNYGSYY